MAQKKNIFFNISKYMQYITYILVPGAELTKKKLDKNQNIFDFL